MEAQALGAFFSLTFSGFWAQRARETPVNAQRVPNCTYLTHLRGGTSGRACSALSVLKRCVPKTLAFAFGQRLRSKTRCFKTRVLGRRLPYGKPQEREVAI